MTEVIASHVKAGFEFGRILCVRYACRREVIVNAVFLFASSYAAYTYFYNVLRVSYVPLGDIPVSSRKNFHGVSSSKADSMFHHGSRPKITAPKE